VNARHKFRKGVHVRMTEECAAIVGKRSTTPRTGVVVGYGRLPDSHLVRVLRDGLRTPESWDCEYWEVEEGK